jgi:hypothetical protein
VVGVKVVASICTMDWKSPDEHTPQAPPRSGSGKAFNFIEFIHSDLVEGDKQAMVGKILTVFEKQTTAAAIVLFKWNPTGLNSFLAKLDQLPPVATPPPHSLREISDTVGGARSRILMAGLLSLVKEASGCDVIDGSGGVAGISCRDNQQPRAAAYLVSMGYSNKWVAEVMATGPPLEAPLATFHVVTGVAGTTRPLCQGHQDNNPIQLRHMLWKV